MSAHTPAKLGKATHYLCAVCRKGLPMVEVILGLRKCIECRAAEGETK